MTKSTPSHSDPAQIHASAFVIDTHADTPQRFVDESWDFVASPLGPGHLNLETARRGNLAAEFFAIWPEPAAWKGRFAHRALSLIDGVHEQVRRHPDALALCTSPADILAARAAGKFAVLMGIEGGHAIENSLALLRDYYRLGVRYMTLTWANSNDWADSSGDLDDANVPHHNGLTAFGYDVDVLSATRAPILASHSAARALTNSPRNLTDDQLRAIAANGGAIMVNFYAAFIDENYRRAWTEQRLALRAANEALTAEYAAKGEPVPYHLSSQLDREFDRPLRPHHSRRGCGSRRHWHRLRRHLGAAGGHRLRRRPAQDHRRAAGSWLLRRRPAEGSGRKPDARLWDDPGCRLGLGLPPTPPPPTVLKVLKYIF